MTKERNRRVAERVMQAAEAANPRRPDETPFAWRARLLIWTLNTPEGREAFRRATQEGAQP